jgi:multiple sugar transport system substrate-binding protein
MAIGGVALASKSPTARAAPAQSAAVGGTITVWEFIDPKTAGPRPEALRKNIALFQQKYPDIKLNVEVVSANLIYPQLIQSAAAKKGPDVAKVASLFLEEQIRAGTLDPLDDFTKDMDKGDWLLPWETTVWDGHKYAIPYEYRNVVLMYRKQAFAQKGLTPPKTWQEVAEVAGKIGPDGPMGIGMGLGAGELGNWVGEWFPSAVWSAGGEVFDTHGKAVFNSPAGVRAVQIIPDLIFKYKGMSKAVLGWAYNEPHEALRTGTALMIVLGSVRFRTIRAGGAPDVAMLRFPGYGSNPGASFSYGWTLTMPKYGRNKQAAWKYIEFMTSPEAQVNIAKGGEGATRKSTYNDPWFRSEEAADLIWVKEAIQQQGRALKTPEKWTVLQGYLVEAIQKIVLQNVPVKEALDEAAGRYNALVGVK